MNTFMRFAGEVLSGGNVKTTGGYVVLNFEVAGFSSFRDIKKSFRGGGEGGHRR